MSDDTVCTPVRCSIYSKSLREICKSLVFNVDFVWCALTLASFATRVVSLNAPSAVV